MTKGTTAPPPGDISAATPERPAFRLPDAAATPVAERRTWESYASDFRDLTAQLATLQQQHNDLHAEAHELRARAAALQAQRQEDRQRLALAERGRRAMEASSAGQASRVRNAESALAGSQATVAELGQAHHRTAVDNERLHGDLAAAQADVVALRAEAERLRGDLAGAQADAVALRAEDARLRENLATARADVVALRIEDARLRAAHDKLVKANALPAAAPPPPAAIARAVPRGASPSPIDRLIAALSLRRARAAARDGRWQQASTLYEVVLLSRDEPRLWVQLGNMQRELGDHGAAAAAYREAIAGDPRNAEAHALLGIAEAGRGDAAAAHDAYRQALRLDPGLTETFGELRAVAQADAA